VEYYYKARWGFADEFIRLFKKNHFPVLNAGDRAGAHSAGHRGGASFSTGPRTAAGLSRHDRVEERGGAARAIPEAELKRLFPDQDTFRREEQRRFEILAAHWDLRWSPSI